MDEAVDDRGIVTVLRTGEQHVRAVVGRPHDGRRILPAREGLELSPAEERGPVEVVGHAFQGSRVSVDDRPCGCRARATLDVTGL